ncbi:MAG: hypothetical protein J6X60_08170, partial [Ruminiclostridium sp.]|nr:hypothetical protein [Ruminiclostridium sp.]
GPWLAIKYNNSTAFVFAELFTSTEPKTSTAASTAAPETAAPAETEETTPVTEDTTPDAVIDDPETVPEIVVPDTVVTDKNAETTKSIDNEDDKDKAAATADADKKDGGFGSLLLALGCAIGVFLIVGVIPVVIHKIHHKRIYQY